MGRLPSTLGQLTIVSTNSAGLVAGPFLASVPTPPGGWASYTYTPNVSAGTFTITTTGDGTSVGFP
jgi:hypothetical protein